MVEMPHDEILREAPEVFEKWDEYDLKEEILSAIYELGFETPSFIQKTAIKPIIAGRDIRAHAQSGTGKTAAFAVGALQRLREERTTQVLVLVSTREMAEQNADRIASLAKNMDVGICVCTGNVLVRENIIALEERPHIVVCTPGRCIDLLLQKYIKSQDIHLCIIDEADALLGEGFLRDTITIFKFLPRDMQVAMFSATWKEEEITVAEHFLNNPVVIDLRHDEQTLKGISQFYILCGAKPRNYGDIQKLYVLIDLFTTKKCGQCIVFVNTRNKAEWVCEKLLQRNIPSEMIHGTLSVQGRQAVIDKFREGSARLLISTEILGRGFDVQQLSVVINFDIPKSRNKHTGAYELDESSYIHRIGRAGRFGRKGIALNLVYQEEMPELEKIKQYYLTNIEAFPTKMDLQ